jgi:alkylhydroperoxidase family enzyme
LIPLDLTLLHAPPLADGYNSFVGALRTKTIIDSSLLELSISRVAVLNQAVYEWNIHAPLAIKAGIQHAELNEAQTTYVALFKGGKGETDQATNLVKIVQEIPGNKKLPKW